jgi:hypothetical protein
MRKTPPSGFVRRLHAFNPDLRVRWSYERKKFVVECKSRDRRGLVRPVRYEETPTGIKERLLPELSDKRIGWRDGYYAIFYVSKLNDAVFAELAAGDMAKYKRVGDYDRSVREAEQRSADRRERWQKSEMEAHSNEVWNYMNIRGSQAFPGGKSL